MLVACSVHCGRGHSCWQVQMVRRSLMVVELVPLHDTDQSA